MQLHICLIFRSKKRQVMGGNAMTRLGIRSTWDAENNVLEFNIFFLCMYKSETNRETFGLGFL